MPFERMVWGVPDRYGPLDQICPDDIFKASKHSCVYEGVPLPRHEHLPLFPTQDVLETLKDYAMELAPEDREEGEDANEAHAKKAKTTNHPWDWKECETVAATEEGGVVGDAGRGLCGRSFSCFAFGLGGRLESKWDPTRVSERRWIEVGSATRVGSNLDRSWIRHACRIEVGSDTRVGSRLDPTRVSDRTWIGSAPTLVSDPSEPCAYAHPPVGSDT